MIKKESENEKKIIKLLKILLKNSFSKDEIMEELNIKPATFSKYLSIIKSSGFEILKKQKKYSIKTHNNNIYFDGLDLSILAHIAVLGELFLPIKKAKAIKEIIDEFLFESSSESKKNYFEKYKLFKSIKRKTQNDRKIEMFQKALDKNLNLKIISNKSLKEHTLKPLKYKWGVDKIIFVFLSLEENKIKEIDAKKIIKMTFAQQENYIEQSKDIIFELYGRLAKKYVLKENEIILEKLTDKTVVLNSSNNPQMLFRRLLRYDDLCKVTYPKDSQKQFREIIKKSLDNLTKLNHN